MQLNICLCSWLPCTQTQVTLLRTKADERLRWPPDLTAGPASPNLCRDAFHASTRSAGST
eukprot:6201853-Pleurochrysis_carterae.AAC.1